MDTVGRIERALHAALDLAEGTGSPPRLAEAMRHAVFPQGARVRPRLCLAVAGACGSDDQALPDAAAAAIELLHCASLVHDDLPCFDDAATRRGKPSVHRAFGEPLAVLAGDALIVLAFQAVAQVACAPQRIVPLTLVIARSVGMPAGIVAGQAWECEPKADLREYHRAKTGSLFSAAAVAGAVAAGASPDGWRQLGETLGEAYQVADDLRDAASDEDEIGKPTARDAALGRPSVVAALGIPGTVAHLERLVARAIDAIPPCARADELRALIASEARRLMPRRLARSAA